MNFYVFLLAVTASALKLNSNTSFATGMNGDEELGFDIIMK